MRARQRSYLRAIALLDSTVIIVAVAVGYVARFGDRQAIGSDIPYGLIGPGLVLA